MEAPDADAYDLLAHLAFNVSLVSRDERAKAFLNRTQDFLGRFRGKAREILELLVDKYRVGARRDRQTRDLSRAPSR